MIELNSNKMGPTWEFLWVLWGLVFHFQKADPFMEQCFRTNLHRPVLVRVLLLAVSCLESNRQWNEIRATFFVDLKTPPLGFMIWHLFFENDQHLRTCLVMSLARTEIRRTCILVVKWETSLKWQLQQMDAWFVAEHSKVLKQL